MSLFRATIKLSSALLLSVLLFTPSRVTAIQYVTSCSEDPIGRRFLAAIRKLPLNTPERDWLLRIKMSGLSAPDWTPIDPLTKLQAIREVINEHDWYRPKAGETDAQMWARIMTHLVPFNSGHEPVGWKDMDIWTDTATVDFGPEIGPLLLVRVNSRELDGLDLAGRDLPLSPLSVWHRGLVIERAEHLEQLNGSLLGGDDPRLATTDFDLVLVDGKPVIISQGPFSVLTVFNPVKLMHLRKTHDGHMYLPLYDRCTSVYGRHQSGKPK